MLSVLPYLRIIHLLYTFPITFIKVLLKEKLTVKILWHVVTHTVSSELRNYLLTFYGRGIIPDLFIPALSFTQTPAICGPKQLKCGWCKETRYD